MFHNQTKTLSYMKTLAVTLSLVLSAVVGAIFLVLLNMLVKGPLPKLIYNDGYQVFILVFSYLIYDKVLFFLSAHIESEDE